MPSEHSRTVLHLSRDDRLIVAVGGAVAHFAERVGMDDAARTLLTGALEDLCRQTLPLLNGNGEGMDVAIEDFDDRLQISVEHRGEPQPSVGVESFIAECARDSKQRGKVKWSLGSPLDQSPPPALQVQLQEDL